MTPSGTEKRSSRNPIARMFVWIGRELTRIRLTVWLLIVMWVTMVVGSIFPQGYGPETYIESWGEAKYELFSRFGLLNLFHSKYFLALGLILLLNLVFCSVIRWMRRGGGGMAFGPPSHARTLTLAGGGAAAAKKTLVAGGYKILSESDEAITARRGPWPEGVSLLYHLGMGVAIVGFILSALFSFEGDVTLYPGEPERVPTVSADTGFHGFTHGDADTLLPDDRYVELTLKEFITEWELYKNEVNPDGKYYPKDWMSDLAIVDDDGASSEKMVEVNRPLRVSGLTFYQMAYEQEFDVVVSAGGVEVERVRANAYVPFTLDSIGGMFFPGTMRVGTLYEKYQETRPVVPHVTLSWQPPEETVEADDAMLADAGEESEAAEADTAAA
ncbi:MAG: cytochrome c biogenesis protein ResB, partial [Candidatus Eisenbacteria bacterium]